MNIKKFWALVLILVMALTLAAGCSNQEQAESSEPAEQKASSQEAKELTTLEKIKQEGKLVAGLDDAFPPFGFRDEKNNLVGFDIDLGNEIAKKLGVEMVWQPTEWNGVVMSLQSKKFDIIMSGMSITPERKEAINFAGPYIATGQVVVVKADNNEIKTKEDLKGKIVGTQLGSTGEEAAKSTLEGLKDLKLYNKYTDAFNDLFIGRLDALVVDEITAVFYMDKKPGSFKIPEGLMLTYEPMGIGVRKEDTELLNALNKAIEELIEDGTYAEISKKWFGKDKSKELENIQ